MSKFRVVLAIVFSGVIVRGLWQYYATQDIPTEQDPVAHVRQTIIDRLNLGAVEEIDQSVDEELEEELDMLQELEQNEEIVDMPTIEAKLHSDFSTGMLAVLQMKRVLDLGVIGGAVDGSIVMLQYCHFASPYCIQAYHDGVLYEYQDAFPQELQYIFKPFPPTVESQVILPHHALLCAMNQGSEQQFISYHNALYQERGGLTEAQLADLASELKYDKMFNECLTNRKYRLLIQQEAKLGQQLFGIRSLPTFVFLDKENGNYIVVPGLYETADVLSAIAYLQESR